MTTTEPAVKTCMKCNVVKPLDDFYKHPRMADGRLGKCKTCTKTDVRANRLDKVEYYREYDRERTKTARRIEHLDKNCKKFRRENPEKYAAHLAVAGALRKGVLVRQPCEVCNRHDRIHAHHDDYTKPLEVRWLCAEHHVAHHRATGQPI